jgi:hypothetical protein
MRRACLLVLLLAACGQPQAQAAQEPPAQPERFTVTTAGKRTILVDSADGKTWSCSRIRRRNSRLVGNPVVHPLLLRNLLAADRLSPHASLDAVNHVRYCA